MKHTKFTKEEKKMYDKLEDDIKPLFLQLEKIKNIDLEKESLNIWSNPRLYFDKYLKEIDGRVALLAKIEVYLKLRDLDVTENETSTETANYLIKKLTLSGYLDILRDFYIYATEILSDILDNGYDFMLDLYNSKKIDKIVLSESMGCLESVKESLSKDKINLLEAIKAIDEKKSSMKGGLDSPFSFM